MSEHPGKRRIKIEAPDEEEMVPKKLRKFDESVENAFDIIIVVEKVKFYLSKCHLAQHSPVFKAMFFGSYVEADKKEVELKEMLAQDFQLFLETINGEMCVTDQTVEAILKVADKYQSSTALSRCERFLLKMSTLKTQKKFELACRYMFEEVKLRAVASITSSQELRAVVPEDISTLDDSTMTLLFKKTMELLPSDSQNPFRGSCGTICVHQSQGY